MSGEVAIQFSSVGFRYQIPNPKWYNPFQKRQGPGISHIDLTVLKGKIVGLVGTNGAGKTTLLRIISGVLPLSEGEISKDGEILSKELDSGFYAGTSTMVWTANRARYHNRVCSAKGLFNPISR